MIAWVDIYEAAVRDVRSVGDAAVWRSGITKFYYSLFHRLTHAGASLFASAPTAMRAQVERAFSHTQMARVSEAYRHHPQARSQQPLDQLASPRLPALVTLCIEFLRLQSARHVCDYDLAATVTIDVALDMWDSADNAHAAIAAAGGTPEYAIFLTALLLHDKWTRRG